MKKTALVVTYARPQFSHRGIKQLKVGGNMAKATPVVEKHKPEPPDHLSEDSKELWRKVIPKHISVGRLAVLIAALEARDRAEECRLTVDREGLTTTTETTKAVHIHPLLKVERENRQLFARLWTQLHLHWNVNIDGRG